MTGSAAVGGGDGTALVDEVDDNAAVGVEEELSNSTRNRFPETVVNERGFCDAGKRAEP